MARRDLQTAGSEVPLDVGVGDDRQLAPDEREDHGPADQVGVALVVRVHRHRGVGQHRLGAHGRHLHRALAALERVGQRVHLTLPLLTIHLEIGHDRLRDGIPIRDPQALVDQPAIHVFHERPPHRSGQRSVHREAFSSPIRADAQALQLPQNRPAVPRLEIPDPLEKRSPTNIVPRLALERQFLFHQDLRADPRVIRAG